MSVDLIILKKWLKSPPWISIASKSIKAARWSNLNYSHGNIHEKRAVQLGSKLPESMNLRKLKKQASERRSFMFAISNQTYGGGGGLCLLRVKQLLHKRRSSAEIPKSKAHKPSCEADVQPHALRALLHGAVALTSEWLHTASWKSGLSWSAFDESCLRGQHVSCVSPSAKTFHIDTPLQST